jgi:hypothetical protein
LFDLHSLVGALMSLSDLASLGTFVSGFAVLVSLIFLYFQLRNLNRQVQQAELNQNAGLASARADRLIEFGFRMADPAVAQVMQKVNQGSQDLTAVELVQFLGLARAAFASTEDLFYQHARGVLDETAHRLYRGMLPMTFAIPGYRLAWPLLRNSYGAEYAAFIDTLIAETPPRRYIATEEALAQWKKNAAALLAHTDQRANSEAARNPL